MNNEEAAMTRLKKRISSRRTNKCKGPEKKRPRLEGPCVARIMVTKLGTGWKEDEVRRVG